MPPPSIRQEVSELREQVTRLTENQNSLVEAIKLDREDRKEEREEAKQNREATQREIKGLSETVASRGRIDVMAMLPTALKLFELWSTRERNLKQDRKTNVTLGLLILSSAAAFCGWSVVAPRDRDLERIQERVANAEVLDARRDTQIDRLERKCAGLAKDENTTRSVFWSELNQLLSRLGFEKIDDPLGWTE